MNPSSNEASGIQLPPPVTEQPPLTALPNGPLQPSAERGPAGPEMSAALAVPTTAVPPPVSPLPMALAGSTITPQSSVTLTTQTDGVQTADDGDLIEKEWVEKAKRIVEQNRDDPYKQTEELTVFKADYMQKRYNKTIKLNK